MAGELYSPVERLMFRLQTSVSKERDQSLRASLAYKVYQTKSLNGFDYTSVRNMLDGWSFAESSYVGFKFRELFNEVFSTPLSKELEAKIVQEISRWFDLTRWKISRDPLTDPEYEGLFI